MQVFFVLFAGHIRPNSQSACVESPISASIEFSGHMPAQFFPSGDAKYKKSRRPEAPRRRNLRGNFAGGCRDSSDFLLPLRKIRLLIHSQHHHGIRRNSLQNNARDKRNVGTRRMAASGRGLRDERRFVRPQDLRHVFQQARRRGPSERGCGLHRLGQYRVAGTPTSAHGASSPNRPKFPAQARCPTCRPSPRSPLMHRRPPRWTTCRSKADGKHTRRLGSPAAFFISKSLP